MNDSTLFEVQKLWAEILFKLRRMPCCGLEILYGKGPEGGLCENIRCAHCQAEWNINPPYFIERIGIHELKDERRIEHAETG